MKKDFNGYGVIARDAETQETLLMGRIVAYNRVQNTIEVETEPQVENIKQRRMNVLIFQEGEAYAFNGTYRKALNANQIGIALYKGSVKADRKNERFALDLNAEIIERITKMGVKTADRSIPIHIADISRSGIRLQVSNVELKIHDKTAIRFSIHHQTKIYYAQIVRVGDHDTETGFTEYGCKLLTMQAYKFTPGETRLTKQE